MTPDDAADGRGADPLCGLLNLHKPPGLTSRDVVDLVTRPLGRGVKVGHAGTLDPLATGVLVVCVGPATRLIEYVQRQQKTYRTVVRLGATSDTDDADGVVTPAADPPVATAARVEEALAPLVGDVMQKPPGYSALKVKGRRAYDLARAGAAPDLAPRPVRIDALTVLSYDWPRLELEVRCGAGTYIRSIARDVGAALGCGGLVDVLVRTRIGPFTLETAVDPTGLTAASIAARLRPAAEALADLPAVRLDDAQRADVKLGRAVEVGADAGLPSLAGEVALFGPGGELVAVGVADPRLGRVAPRRVLI